LRSSAETTARIVRAGLIGSGIGQSRTPALHMQEGRANGLDYRYDLIDLDELGAGPEALGGLIEKAEKEGFAGLNITHPCKQAAIEFVDDLSDDARVLQSLNTITFAGGKRKGHNTDWWGFDKGFRRGLPDARVHNAVQIGAGGAGVAVAHAMAVMGARRLTVFDLSQDRTSALIDRLARVHGRCEFVLSRDIVGAMNEADGLVHATPTGMTTHPGIPIDPELLSARHWVAEIVYFPLETQLLAEAVRRGCRIVNGGGMAVYQAVGAFELFTGIRPDAERMIRHFGSLGEGGEI
jgi:shikimate dehydrogenase